MSSPALRSKCFIFWSRFVRGWEEKEKEGGDKSLRRVSGYVGRFCAGQAGRPRGIGHGEGLAEGEVRLVARDEGSARRRWCQPLFTRGGVG